MKRKVSLLYKAINSQKRDVVGRLFEKYIGQEIELMNVVREKYKTDPYVLPFSGHDSFIWPSLNSNVKKEVYFFLIYISPSTAPSTTRGQSKNTFSNILNRSLSNNPQPPKQAPKPKVEVFF